MTLHSNPNTLKVENTWVCKLMQRSQNCPIIPSISKTNIMQPLFSLMMLTDLYVRLITVLRLRLSIHENCPRAVLAASSKELLRTPHAICSSHEANSPGCPTSLSFFLFPLSTFLVARKFHLLRQPQRPAKMRAKITCFRKRTRVNGVSPAFCVLWMVHPCPPQTNSAPITNHIVSDSCRTQPKHALRTMGLLYDCRE